MNNDSKKKKSRMCNKILNNGVDKCPYGDKCNFAHSLDEITILDCSYGDKCVFVVKDKDNTTLNIDNNKICYFCHPDETISNFHERVGNVATCKNYIFKNNNLFLPEGIEPFVTEPIRLQISKEIEQNDKWSKVCTTKPEDTIYIKKEHVLDQVKKLLEIGETNINIKVI